ncbi:MAG: hypothetical protein A2Y25_00565 [Candidatus Melainabacteria bacterium GWF2_37_15]|nr:MAG: hypothetical protein A2Y25_00565 [Candidatus Melainabacteria bacterium GWF2_37_15]
MIKSISPAFKASYIPEYPNAQQAGTHKKAILARAAELGENVTVKTVNVIETKNPQWSPLDLRIVTEAPREKNDNTASNEKEGLHSDQISKIFEAFDRKSFLTNTINLNVN